VKSGTWKKERQATRRLLEFFKECPLKSIDAQNIEGYRAWRAENGCGPGVINTEFVVLKALLRRADLVMVATGVRLLPEQVPTFGSLSHTEKVRLRQVAKRKPGWNRARLAMEVALATGARGHEIRCLRWRDVNFMERAIFIRESKTEAGIREIPLNTDGWSGVLELWDQAQKLGVAEADHYLFPACENGNIDASRPITTWRTSWRSLTKAAGLPGLGFHRLRHQVVSELLEAGQPDEVVRQIVGHVDRRMTARYAHIRRETKRKALAAISSQSNAPTRAGYVTNHVTREEASGGVQPQVIENMVGTWGLEPQTSTVSNQR